ncbi:unnamed protein product [Mucor hiemalis]
MLTHEDKFGLKPNFKGPFIITEYFPDFGTCRLETMAGQKLDVLVHKDRLKHAKGDKPGESWYDPTSCRRQIREVTTSRSGMRTNYQTSDTSISTSTPHQVEIFPSSSAFTTTSISGTQLLEDNPVVLEEDSHMGGGNATGNSSSTVTTRRQQQQDTTATPTIASQSIIDIYDDVSSGDNLQDTEVVDVLSDSSDDSQEEFMEASSSLPTEEENNLHLQRDLLDRRQQAFEADRVKVQQQQQVSWDKQKVKEEELKKKEEELKRREEEQGRKEVAFKKKVDEEQRNMEAESSSSNKAIASSNVEAGSSSNSKAMAINVEDNLSSVAASQQPKHQEKKVYDSDMIEAPTTKHLPQVPQLDSIPGTVPEWPFTFQVTSKGSTSTSSSENPFTAKRIAQEEEEIEDLVQQSTRYHQGSKRRVFKPTTSSRKRGKSRPSNQQ